jgi:hypothetical protein
MEMKYSDGNEIIVGDRVKVWDGSFGIVVCSMDTEEYTPSYPEEEWGYLRVGILIDTDKAGLIHCTESEEELELIERSKNT